MRYASTVQYSELVAIHIYLIYITLCVVSVGSDVNRQEKPRYLSLQNLDDYNVTDSNQD